jgi:hypothetical protein
MADILQLALIELVKYSVPRAADAAIEQLKSLGTQLDLQKGRVGWAVTELEGWGQTVLGSRLELESVFLTKNDCLDALDAARMCARYAGPSEVNLSEIDEILLRGTGASL